MKHHIVASIKDIIQDKVVAGMFIILWILSIVYSLFAAFSVQPSDIRIYTHYTSYGDANFYTTPWHYLVAFVAFGVLVLIGHSAIAVKLYIQKNRSFAMAFIGVSYVVLFVATVVSLKVFQLSNNV